jgi:hypothetical protein
MNPTMPCNTYSGVCITRSKIATKNDKKKAAIIEAKYLSTVIATPDFPAASDALIVMLNI